jgi:CBS domain-containing protein
MHIIGKAQKVTIYIGESDRWGRKPLHLAILEMLKAESCAGATVTRALAGFGAHSQIHTTSVVALSADLPLVVEWVDNPARVEQVMPKLRQMVREGLITVQEVDVAFYSHRDLRHLSAFVSVQDIMSREVFTVTPATPLAEVVELLINQMRKTLPVVDTENKVVGILTDGGPAAQNEGAGQQRPPTPDRRRTWKPNSKSLRRRGQTVAEVMTPPAPPITVTAAATLPQVVELLLQHNIKRLLVVDDDGHLIGLVSRVDILRAFAHPLAAEADRAALPPGRLTRVREVMLTNVPQVNQAAPLAEVVALLVNSVQRRVVVVDEAGRVAGIITDGDLIHRATPTERSGLIRTLSRRFPLGQAEAYSLSQRPAAEVMTQPVLTIPPDALLIEALQLMLERQIKRLPVVDAQGQLLGLGGRGGILQAMG